MCRPHIHPVQGGNEADVLIVIGILVAILLVLGFIIWFME